MNDIHESFFHSYRWIKNGENFNVSSHVERISQRPGAGTLTFHKPTAEDEGTYFCYAENQHGIARSKSIVLRKAFLENFKNSSAQRALEATEGEAFQLECDAPSGYPKPIVFWMIQTVQGAIKGIDSDRTTLDPDGNLWFSAVSRDDASKESFYVCSAASASAVVNEYKLGNRVALKVIPRAHKSFRPPTLQYVSSATMFGLRGKSIELFCVYDGTPLPKTAWSKDGKLIEYNERLNSENYGKSLKIKKTDAEDEGIYTCDVSSENGEVQTTTFDLKIQSPPRFTIEPESKNVTANATFEICCEAVGAPKPDFEWLFNGRSIKEIENPRLEITEGKLIISEADESDTGNYACSASNTRGKAYKNIYINVQ